MLTDLAITAAQGRRGDDVLRYAGDALDIAEQPGSGVIPWQHWLEAPHTQTYGNRTPQQNQATISELCAFADECTNSSPCWYHRPSDTPSSETVPEGSSIRIKLEDPVRLLRSSELGLLSCGSTMRKVLAIARLIAST